MSANCEYYQELMSRMLDGDLLNAEADALREHIRTCRECRMLCAAFSSMTLSLREEEIEPPVSLAEGVMSRIRSYEAELALEQEDDPAVESVPLRSTPRRSHARKKSAPWRSTLVAACLVVIIGAGAVLAIPQGRKAVEAEAADSAATAYGRAAAPAAAEPETAAAGVALEGGLAMPMNEFAAEAAPEEAEAAPAEAVAAAEPAEDAPAAEVDGMPQAAAEEEALETEIAEDIAGAAGYDLANPAYVPEGSEDAFKALLTDAGWMPEASFHAFYAVEHNGIIYEFMTDENEEYLLWRDAAEGFPTLSKSSFDDLWAIFK